MGQKVHPIGIRLGIVKEHTSVWYADKRQYADYLLADLKVREYLQDKLKNASVSRIDIARPAQTARITIHTARPGILIGRKGEAVKKMRQGLEEMTGKKVKVEVTEIDKPDVDSTLVAENIGAQLEKRIGHSRAMKRAVSQAMRQGAQGIRIEVSGRLAGADMARREWVSEGRIPRNTLRANIDYGTHEALTTFGRIGIKVWVYKGEVLRDDRPKAASKPEDAYVTP